MLGCSCSFFSSPSCSLNLHQDHWFNYSIVIHFNNCHCKPPTFILLKYILNWSFLPLSIYSKQKYVVKHIYADVFCKEKFIAKCMNISCTVEIKPFIWLRLTRKAYIIFNHAKTLLFFQNLGKLLTVFKCP